MNHQQWRAGAGSLKHPLDLRHTFAPNETERQQMCGCRKMRKQKKTEKGHDPFVRTPSQDLTVTVDAVRGTHNRPLRASPVHFLSTCMYACFVGGCTYFYLFILIIIMYYFYIFIYLQLGLRITCPNSSQGKPFIWITFTEMI